MSIAIREQVRVAPDCSVHVSSPLLEPGTKLFRPAFASSAFISRGGFDSSAVLAAWKDLPASVLRAERKRRAHLSGVLARNETGRDYAYNRHLFKRIGHGWYQFNPALALRCRRRSRGVKRRHPCLHRQCRVTRR